VRRGRIEIIAERNCFCRCAFCHWALRRGPLPTSHQRAARSRI